MVRREEHLHAHTTKARGGVNQINSRCETGPVRYGVIRDQCAAEGYALREPDLLVVVAYQADVAGASTGAAAPIVRGPADRVGLLVRQLHKAHRTSPYHISSLAPRGAYRNGWFHGDRLRLT